MLQYLLKFSISLAVLFIFYMAVLRPLTFYTWNRFYLLCYSLSSFFIPFIDISTWITKTGEHNNQFTDIIPVLGTYHFPDNAAVTVPSASAFHGFHASQWLLLFFFAGAFVMLIRVMLQYRSLRRIRRRAVLLHSDARVQLFQTTAPVSPFSFGNAIYYNNNLHSSEELQRIIQHEFVHVKQKHSVDMLIGELLCVVNWFNPFAWLIRKAIRQNLEFIADNAVIENGIDKKEYQYLLLKVVGIPQYSIGNNFNFSSLKKRIAMMNKIKTAKLHLTKFLFVLPLLAILLLAFRNNAAPRKNKVHEKQLTQSTAPYQKAPVVLSAVVSIANDTLPGLPPPAPSKAAQLNIKGYIVAPGHNGSERVVVVKDKSGKIIKTVELGEWKKNKTENESLYGPLPLLPPPPPPIAPVSAVPPASTSQEVQAIPPVLVAVLNPVTNKTIPSLPVVNTRPLSPIPADVLTYIDDKEMLAGAKIEDLLKPNDIEVMNVYSATDAVERYGAKGKHGAIDIKTKSYWRRKNANVKFDADSSVRSHFEQFIVNGTITTSGNESIIEGSFSFENKPERPLLVFDGHQLPELIKCSPRSGRYSMRLLSPNEGIAKYGDTAKYGALEITTLSKHAEQK